MTNAASTSNLVSSTPSSTIRPSIASIHLEDLFQMLSISVKKESPESQHIKEKITYEFNRPSSPPSFLKQAKTAAKTYKKINFYKLYFKASACLFSSSFETVSAKGDLFLVDCPSFGNATSSKTTFVIQCSKHAIISGNTVVAVDSPLYNLIVGNKLTYYLPTKCKELCFQNCRFQGDLVVEIARIRLVNSVVEGTVQFQKHKKRVLILEENSSVTDLLSVNGTITKSTIAAPIARHKKTSIIKNIVGSYINVLSNTQEST